MYIVTRFGKEFKSIAIGATYEATRSAVRRYIRKNMNKLQDQMVQREDKHRSNFFKFVDGEVEHYNPSLQAYGFRIKRI